MKVWTAGVIFASIPLLSACPPPEKSVRRDGYVVGLSSACAETALRAVDGVTITEVRENGSKGFEVTPSWGGYVSTMRVMNYEMAGVGKLIFALSHQSNKTEILAGHLWGRNTEAKLTSDEARTARNAMGQVEHAIGQACGTSFDKLRTTCGGGIDCSSPEIVGETNAT